jgi:hypothetical protein
MIAASQNRLWPSPNFGLISAAGTSRNTRRQIRHSGRGTTALRFTQFRTGSVSHTQDASTRCRRPNLDISHYLSTIEQFCPRIYQRYVPTTALGARLPSILLRDSMPIFDRLGRWFTGRFCSRTRDARSVSSILETPSSGIRTLKLAAHLWSLSCEVQS